MDKITFLKSIKEIEFDDKGNFRSVKGSFNMRSTDEM